jgi:hypothetical protein
MTDYLTIAEAAIMLQPFIGQMNSINVLAEWRRRASSYRKRLETPPRYCRDEGQIKYPRAEILRCIQELHEFRSRPLKLI